VHLSNFVKAVGLALCVLTATAAGPAHADWKRAESPRFIVYSRGGEGALRRYVQSLEMYDYILRYRMGLPLDAVPARKLPIYLVNNRSGLVAINPATGPNVLGTYFPVGEDIFAAAVDDREMDYLLHEYFHHFSFELGSAANYSGWLIEGLAEYFMTAEITDNSVRIGMYNDNRAQWLLNSTWLPLEDLLSKRPGEIKRRGDQATYYPVAWLLTHWFMGDETRRAQLGAYITQVQAGTDPVAAMQAATGMGLPALRAELRRYLHGRLTIINYEVERPDPAIVVTSLPASADDLLLVGQRLKVGVKDEDRAETAALVRRLAAAHPDDPFAMLQLGHAELHFGDPVAGETVLARLLEREPDNIEALQLMAARYMALADEQPEDLSLRVRAREHLARAYRADPGQYYTLHLLARNRQGQAGYPNENDLTTWSLAYDLAPQLSGIRLGYASALMQASIFDEAIILLEPLANAPHGGSASDAAQALLERARAGQPPLSVEELDAAAAADEPSQPDPEAS
jgi:Flp pilus assembly protein TadD